MNIKKQSDFKREFSAGCVVVKKAISNQHPPTGGAISNYLFLLGKHSGYHKWVLPKGLIEKGEKDFETAVRETEEEMGVKARLILDKPIYIEKYIYWADYKDLFKNSKHEIRNSKQIQNSNDQNSKQDKSSRKVAKYQESGGKKTKVFKTVSFYLAEFVSGDPKNHGWEMEDAQWFSYEQALSLMSFQGEKNALEKAYQYLKTQ